MPQSLADDDTPCSQLREPHFVNLRFEHDGVQHEVHKSDGVVLYHTALIDPLSYVAKILPRALPP